MTDFLETQWPTFAPINISFDKNKLYREIIKSNILKKGNIATTHILNGKNYWDNLINFKSKQFKKLKDVPLWVDENRSKLSKYKINTFYQVNISTFSENNLTTAWEGSFKDKDKTPLWIKYNQPWSYRSDVQLPYLQEVVNSLNLKYFSMIRIVYQQPPSIGLIHKDSGSKMNLDYYNSNGISITLNVSSGGANLYFLDKNNNECLIDEDNNYAWHFDDSVLHCTNEVLSDRIQIRIYGNYLNYKKLMNLNKAIY